MTQGFKLCGLVLLAGAMAYPLAGCDMIQSQTGLNKSTQTGAVAGGAFGGVIAALADANPGWIAASVLLGGVTGGAIGHSLGKEDATKHAQNNLRALDTLSEGQSESWSDLSTGNSGSTTVHNIQRMADGSVCKTYTETVRTKTETVTRDGTACKPQGGTWAVKTG